MIEDFDNGVSKKSFSKARISEIIPRNDFIATDLRPQIIPTFSSS